MDTPCIHFVYIYYYLSILWQPLGNHPATIWQPVDPRLAYRNPIDRLDRVCKKAPGAVRKVAKKKAQE